MANADQCIVDACKNAWEGSFLRGTPNKNNCSGFVKAVASQLGISLPATADADGIAEAVKAWKKVDSGEEAQRLAANGSFVLVVLKGKDHHPPRAHGHVGVVVSGELYRQKYPMMWCGSIGHAQSEGDKSVGEVWNRADRDSVQYYTFTTFACKR